MADTKTTGKHRVFGHEHGVITVRNTLRRKLGLKYLPYILFQRKIWNRPKMEVDTLMRLLVSSLKKRTANFSGGSFNT
jgi:undecaprenyl diphosphate synthase